MKFEYKCKTESLAKKFAEAIGAEVIKKDSEYSVVGEYSDLKELKASSEKYNEGGDKAEIMEALYEAMSSLYREVDRKMSYLWGEIDFLYGRLREHEKGHIPSNLTPGQLDQAIKTLGLENDYEVKKKVVYAQDGRGNLVVEGLCKKS